MIFLHNREKYKYKGKMKSSINNEFVNFYYDYQKPETMERVYIDNKETIIMTCVIEIEGDPKLVPNDLVILQNGHEYKIDTISPNYETCNPLISDFVKQKVKSYYVGLK